MKMRVIVATDGGPGATGALHVARGLREGATAEIEVITALHPVAKRSTFSGETLASRLDAMESVRASTQEHRVREQLARIGGGAELWPVRVALGAPAAAIVRHVDEFGATLIMLGQGRHRIYDRVFGGETAVRVIRMAGVPVLAVPEDARSLPTVAVAAVDFEEPSRAAMKTALRVLAPGARLHIAHAFRRPAEEMLAGGGLNWLDAQRERLSADLREMEHQLPHLVGITVHTHLLEGDAATEVLALADDVGAGLISAGSHGAGMLGRLVLGSVSERLLRGARCAVLITPPAAVARAAAVAEEPGSGRAAV